MRLVPFVLLLVATSASAATAPTVAVLPFRDLSGAKASVGEAIRETVTSDLKTLGGVRVVERAELDRVLGEQHLQGAAEVDTATAARVGKLLGATLIAVGAYQQTANDVRLTARFVQVESGEIVGTAKVDGRASDFLRLQDKVTAELLRSAGMAQHIKKIVERQRAPLKSMRTLELYGDAVVAENDEKKAELLKLAVAEDASFTYAATDLAALEKRMKQVRGGRARQTGREGARAPRRVRQGEGSAEAGDDGGAGVRDAAAGAALPHHGRARALARRGAGGRRRRCRARCIRVDEMALYYVIIAENRCSKSRCGAARRRGVPAPLSRVAVFRRRQDDSWTSIIREKHEVEQGKEKVKEEVARLSSDQRWNLCRVATEYAFAHQYREAQRLFHACFAVGGVDKHALPQLIQTDVALGDWAAARKDLGELEKADPEMYRNMKVGYEMSIPSDV